ncbi:hypothetical protein APA44_27890 [Pseudomonas aeruginosa]|nr:hypothetical protein G039_0305935 [Pseudomonas aeruginosa VRFPA01]KSC34064.1 hypothetical protein AO882_30045 [Pseudomonas paraeruginosa]KSL05869.1 hypothetical protein APA44_27890 [Pseudomonas aeruginosa]OKR54647.1 hypothetical protein BH596_16640 [Pseudomonas aeruginosa]HBP5359712.1 hypothetical protein [Pseudomonas aeruginosa]
MAGFFMPSLRAAANADARRKARQAPRRGAMADMRSSLLDALVGRLVVTTWRASLILPFQVGEGVARWRDGWRFSPAFSLMCWFMAFCRILPLVR